MDEDKLCGTYREWADRALVAAARELRQRETPVEMILYACLRDRRLGGIKFRRQHPVARTPYVADFLCYRPQRLIIEFDGSVHLQQHAADANRQRNLESLGYKVIRFTNDEIYQDLHRSLIKILEAAQIKTP
jgi:very-short-patch-repair endonuclease